MQRKYRLMLGMAGLTLLSSARAQETTTYTYDALGRLISGSTVGGPNDGVQTSIALDPAGNRSNYSVSGTPSPTLSIANASAGEGANLVFTVTRSGSPAGAANVSYATSNGTATAGSDYAPLSGTLNFAAGETTKTIVVATIDDVAAEGSETMFLTLSAPSAGTVLSRAQATGTIAASDGVSVSLAIADAAAVAEGGTLGFRVTKTGATSSTVTVNYQTANGTATAGADYTATSGVLTFAPADIEKVISIPTIDDAVGEPSETVVVNIAGPVGATIGVGGAEGTGSIIDNDGSVNHPPVAIMDTARIARSTSTIVQVLENDYDPDGDVMTITSVSGDRFIIGPLGNVRFVSTAAAGTYVGSYVISDGRGGTATASITVTVP